MNGAPVVVVPVMLTLVPPSVVGSGVAVALVVAVARFSPNNEMIEPALTVALKIAPLTTPPGKIAGAFTANPTGIVTVFEAGEPATGDTVIVPV